MGFKRIDGAVVVAVVGDVDDANDAELRQALGDAVAENPTTLIIDLRAAEHFGSHGVNIVVNTWRDLQGRGSDLILANTPARVRNVLRICGLDNLQGLAFRDSVGIGVAEVPVETRLALGERRVHKLSERL